MKWRNSKERELLASGGSREQTLPNKNNPNPDLSDADADKTKIDLSDVALDDEDEEVNCPPTTSRKHNHKDEQSLLNHNSKFNQLPNWPPDDEDDIEINVT